jgi:hypothetical protein
VGEPELACRIDALRPDQRARHRALVAELVSAAAAIEELPDGYAVRFPARPYLFLRLAEWIELERACCPFLSIRLAFEREDRAIRVSLEGPAGTKSLLEAELSLEPTGAAR